MKKGVVGQFADQGEPTVAGQETELGDAEKILVGRLVDLRRRDKVARTAVVDETAHDLGGQFLFQVKGLRALVVADVKIFRSRERARLILTRGHRLIGRVVTKIDRSRRLHRAHEEILDEAFIITATDAGRIHPGQPPAKNGLHVIMTGSALLGVRRKVQGPALRHLDLFPCAAHSFLIPIDPDVLCARHEGLAPAVTGHQDILHEVGAGSAQIELRAVDPEAHGLAKSKRLVQTIDAARGRQERLARQP